MNTRQLSYFLSIAEHGSLSGASLALGVSQPALSKYLSQLEAELGTELFLRHNKKLYLTAAGRTYLDAANRIISVKEQTYQMIASLSGGYQKTITVGVTPLRGAIAIAKIFPQFHKRYPNVNIEMKEQYSSDLRQSVINHSVNLALGTCIDLEDPEILRISCHEENLVLFVPSFHPLASLASKDPDHLTPIEIERFADTPFLLGRPGSTIRQLADIIFQQGNVQPTVVYEANNNLILKNMAQNGAGIAILAKAHMEPCSSLVYFQLKPAYSVHLVIMAPRDRELSEEERYLMALNFEMESSNPDYHFNPSPMAREILEEFRHPHP